MNGRANWANCSSRATTTYYSDCSANTLGLCPQAVRCPSLRPAIYTYTLGINYCTAALSATAAAVKGQIGGSIYIM